MLRSNKELGWSVGALTAVGAVFTAVGFVRSPECGMLVLTSCAAALWIHMATEYYRYRRLQKFSQELGNLLLTGKPMAIRDYEEGELSILANQIQKLTLRLTEAAEQVRGEKTLLADSLADISHQLRTPLTAMNLTAALLRSQELGDRRRMELASELRQLLERTDWLVETLLKLSKLDAGTVTLASSHVTVRELVRRASEPLMVPMELRDQKLVRNCAQESFTGDPVWTAEALGNILKNAMEHTPDGGTITVSAQQTALYTAITVDDTGPGFKEEDIPHLFERFYRGADASPQSCGIGLALARTVIAAQNGTIRAMNTPSGARFVIKFYRQII